MLAVALHRLTNQGIAQSTFKTPAEVVAWSGVMQGQDYAGAKWSVGCRLAGGTDQMIEQAFADKAILRTWVLRGTLHLVAPADIHWMIALIAPRQIAGNARRYRELELDEQTLARSNEILAKAVSGGKLLSRHELFAILEEHNISTKGQRGVYMLQRASLDRLICQGAAVRNVATFMLLHEAVPDAKTLPRDEAVATLAQRYFTSHGPATLQDFAWWAALPITEARAGLEAVKSHFVQEGSYWLPPSTSNQAASLYLLSGFDEYMLGYKDRSAVLEEQYVQQVVPGKNGVFFPTIVVNGQIAGTWKRAFKKGKVEIVPSPFTPLTAAEMDAFAVAAYQYGDYLGMSVILP